MKQIAAARFKKKCLSMPDTVGPEGIVITKRGRPVARLMPISSSANLIGCMKAKIKITGDIMSTGIKWVA